MVAPWTSRVNGTLRENYRGAEAHSGSALGRPFGMQLQAWGKGILAQPREQAAKMRRVLRANGINFHAEAAAVCCYVTDFGFSTDLTFLDEEVQSDNFAFFLARASLEKKA